MVRRNKIAVAVDSDPEGGTVDSDPAGGTVDCRSFGHDHEPHCGAELPHFRICKDRSQLDTSSEAYVPHYGDFRRNLMVQTLVGMSEVGDCCAGGDHVLHDPCAFRKAPEQVVISQDD